MPDEPTRLSVFQHALGITSRWGWPVRVTQQTVTIRDRQLNRDETRHIDTIAWTGTLTPTQFSPTYTVEFSFTDGDYTVEAQVTDPTLDSGVAHELPHVYTDTGGLCLHERDQWDQTLPIATTIIPWAAEWLLHYELWKGTGTWTGGGATHTAVRRPADGHKLQRALAATG